MKKLFVVALLVLLCLAAVNVQEPAAVSAPTSTPSPTATPISTPYPLERCYVDLTDVTLETLTVQIRSSAPDDWGFYRIGINFSDPPCDPWSGMQQWYLGGVTEGEYSTYWLDHFEKGPQYGQEVCIIWRCRTYYGSYWQGENSEMLYAYNYLPIIQED